MIAELRRSLQDDRLLLNFQPLVNLRTGNLVRFETLVRWEDPVGEAKIDKSFISSMAGDLSKSNIVRASVDLGHSLRLGVVAEGIADSQTWHLLNALGCELAHGYYISRPLSAAAGDRWMESWRARSDWAA